MKPLFSCLFVGLTAASSLRSQAPGSQKSPAKTKRKLKKHGNVIARFIQNLHLHDFMDDNMKCAEMVYGTMTELEDTYTAIQVPHHLRYACENFRVYQDM